jgi:hypothetical protein
MVILLIFIGIAAFAVSFLAVVILTTILFTLCEPKTRFGAIMCFGVPALAILSGLVVWGSTIDLWRYAEPVMQRIAWPALALICLGIITAGFTVAASRRRQLRSKHDGAATSTI